MRARHPTPIVAGLVLCLWGALSASSAHAHHAASQFDRAHPTVLKGVVKALDWRNPHSCLEIETTAAGKKVVWAVELEGPTVMVREGWRRNAVAAGDKVVARVMPVKSGRPAARLIDLTLPTGEVLHMFTPRTP